MTEQKHCTGCRFRSGPKAIIWKTNSEARASMAVRASASRALAALSLIIAASLIFSFSELVEALRSTFTPSIYVTLAVSAVLDFLIVLFVSLSLGLQAFLFFKGTFTLGDFRRATLSFLPLISLVLLAVFECCALDHLLHGASKLIGISTVVIMTVRELERLMFVPAALTLGYDQKDAFSLSRRIYSCDKKLVRHFARETTFSIIISFATFFVSFIFATPHRFARYAEMTKLILPDYNIKLSE